MQKIMKTPMPHPRKSGQSSEDTEGKVVDWFSEFKLSSFFPEGKIILIVGVIGSLIGVAWFGVVPEGYVIGLPCMLIYRVIHGLLTGKTIWWSGGTFLDGYHLPIFCTRRDEPAKYWLAIAVNVLLAYWILKLI